MSSTRTVSDFIVEHLRTWGVKHLYGYSGDGINGILGAMNRAGNEPAFIQVRHEETAALMACAHAKFTGEVGVCLATQGPGAIHLLNGLYDARLDYQPVVAIVGQVAQTSMGSHFQQEIDLPNLFKDVAGSFVEVINDPAQTRHVIDRTFRIAKANRTVACIIIPQDVQDEPSEEDPPHEHGSMHSTPGYAVARVLPRNEQLEQAAAILNAGTRVAMLVGAGALGATQEVIETAEVLGAGIAKALLGKAAVPDDLPFVTGSVGWLGTAASNRMMEECDTLLMIGSGFPYTEFLPKPGQARGVQIDINPGSLGTRYPMEANLVGDSAESLRALIPLLKSKTERSWRQHIEILVKEWRADALQRAEAPANPINPQLLFTKLAPRLPDNAILAADSGTSTVWFARHLPIREGMKASVSGTLATMGCALPYALAGKLAFPDRVAFAFLGDGAMQMNGMTELITVAQEWPKWSDPRLIMLVLNNRDLNYVTWEQRAMAGEPRFDASQTLPDIPYGEYARMIGLNGIRVESPGDIDAAWQSALSADRPTLIDAVTDPNVPTLPPAPTADVTEKLSTALGEERGGDQVERQISREGVDL